MGVLARAHPLRGSRLSRTIRRQHAIIAVRVQIGNDDQYELLKQRTLGRLDQFAHELHHSLLTVNFAGVNVREEEHDQLFAASRFGGSRDGRFGDDERRQRSSFVRTSEL